MERLENLLHTSHGFNFSFWLKGYLEQEEKVLILAKTLHAYSYIIYSVDTTNTAFLNNIAFIDELSLRLKKIDFEFKSRLVKNSKKLEDFFTRFPQFKEHKFILEEKIAETKHRMSLKEEELASKLQRTGGDAWDRLHEQLISNLKDESGKTFNTLRNDAYSSDPILRKSSYEKELALLKQHKIAFAACLNNLKGETIALNSKRKWKTALDRSLFASRLDKKTLTALIKSIEKSLPLWRKYFLAKATFLKKNALTASTATDSNGKTAKGLAFYDLFAPLEFSANTSNKSQLIDEKINAAEILENNLNQSTSEEETKNASPLSKTWTFKEARTYIISRYESFSQEMGNFARRVFAENWIDAEVRQGKVGGAYDEDFALGHQSRIMTNFTGAFSDVITLAHEIGHAFHFYCLRGKPASFFNYPMTLAETASTFAETIVKQSMLKECSQIEKLQLLDMDLQDAGQVLVDILCRFYFEKSVFEQRAKGELSAEDFCTLMKDAQQKSYGKGLNSERHEYMWAVKSHYYSTDLDFYNFPYAFGQLFAAGLYQKYLKEGESFAKTYKNLLSNTGSMKSEALCALAGFDISTTDFWNLGIEMYQKEIEEFCDLVKKATD
ncbi:M3 family oligoendopeptidase [Treponema pectinovorum]